MIQEYDGKEISRTFEINLFTNMRLCSKMKYCINCFYLEKFFEIVCFTYVTLKVKEHSIAV